MSLIPPPPMLSRRVTLPLPASIRHTRDPKSSATHTLPPPVVTLPGCHGRSMRRATFRVRRSTRASCCFSGESSHAERPANTAVAAGYGTEPTTWCDLASTRLTAFGASGNRTRFGPLVPSVARTAAATAAAVTSTAAAATASRGLRTRRRATTLPANAARAAFASSPQVE